MKFEYAGAATNGEKTTYHGILPFAHLRNRAKRAQNATRLVARTR
jgi:hypothetical protein